MPDLSPAQKQYLFRVRREKYLIHVSRIFLFLGFLLLWEVSARRGWIDSFIFSSPSEIWQTFLRMVQDQSLFTHIGITLMETLVSFAFTVFLGIGTAVLLWCCPKLSRILEPYLVVLNSLPKSALAPLLIVWLGANVRTIIVAGISVAIFGSIIRFPRSRPRETQAHPHPRRHKKRRTDKDRPSVFCAPHLKCDESQYWIVPCRRDHRRIHRRPPGTWLPDHLRLPDFQTDMGADVHRDPVYHCDRAVCHSGFY